MFFRIGTKRIFIAWFAAFAMLGHGLLPALVQARLASAAPPWTELCSVLGAQKIPLGAAIADALAGKSAPASSGGMQAQHCALCLAGIDGPLLPPTPLPALSTPRKKHVLPILDLPGRPPLFLAAGSPRGPPQHS